MKALEHIISDVKKKVIKYIMTYDLACGEDYGVFFDSLQSELKVGEPVLKEALNSLHVQKKVKVQPYRGTNLIFLNYENPEIKKLLKN